MLKLIFIVVVGQSWVSRGVVGQSWVSRGVVGQSWVSRGSWVVGSRGVNTSIHQKAHRLTDFMEMCPRISPASPLVSKKTHLAQENTSGEEQVDQY